MYTRKIRPSEPLWIEPMLRRKLKRRHLLARGTILGTQLLNPIKHNQLNRLQVID
jgi:hypothetical protein